MHSTGFALKKGGPAVSRKKKRKKKKEEEESPVRVLMSRMLSEKNFSSKEHHRSWETHTHASIIFSKKKKKSKT
jgi:hypothetical protein